MAKWEVNDDPGKPADVTGDLIRRADAIAAPEKVTVFMPIGRNDSYNQGWLEGARAFCEGVEKNLRDLAPVQVGVKPLEWVNVPTGYGPETYESYAAIGFYQVFTDEDSCFGAVFAEFATNREHFGTTAARGVARVHSFLDAKAAAQADYEARIRSALIATLAPSPDVRAIVRDRDHWKLMMEKAEECLAKANAEKNAITHERDTLAARLKGGAG